MTATAGFLLASQGDVDISVLAATLTGTALIIACGCVLNNYLDRSIDSKMARTKKRASVTGKISLAHAMIYATVMGISGAALLIFCVNALTAAVGLFGLATYVIVYGYAKRHSVHGTLVGTIPGATPPVAGYVAVTNQLDIGALLLFLILVCWQMTHFYSIALYRIKDYKAAGLPVLPVVKGFETTRWQMLVYLIAFVAAACSLTLYGYTSRWYLLVPIFLGAGWVQRWLKPTADTVAWGKQMFLYSLIVLSSLSLAISVDSFFV